MFINQKIKFIDFFNRTSRFLITFLILFIVLFLGTQISVLFIGSEGDTSVTYGNVTYNYYSEKIDYTLDDLGFEEPDDYTYEETISDENKSILGSLQEYSDYYCFDYEYSYYNTGYKITIFSSNYSSVMDKYNELLLSEDGFEYWDITEQEAKYGFDKVFYGDNDYYSIYIVLKDNTTYIVYGDLNQEQAMELATYYINKYE